MTDIARARAMLPNMPVEVFDIWIAPLVKTGGWPFLNNRSPASGQWVNNFSGHSLHLISQLRWELHNLPGSLTSFNPILKKRLALLAKQYITGIRQFNCAITNGPARFRRALAYVRVHKCVPKPVIAIQGTFHLELLDGNHRLAAMLTAGLLPRRSIQVWVGKKPVLKFP